MPTPPLWRRLRTRVAATAPAAPLGGLARTLGAAATALLAAAVAVEALGADTAPALSALLDGAFGTPFSFGQTIMLTSILALTGLAATVPFTAGMLNVGAEGQLYAGALAATAIGLEAPSNTPAFLHVVLVVLGGAVAGGMWGAVPGAMRALAGANEVIVSLMLTFVAALAANHATVELWPSGLAQNTRDLPDAALLPTLAPTWRVTAGAPLAAVAVLLAWFTMTYSRFGFELRATGANPEAARLSGVPVRRVQLLSFVAGGMAAGLAGGVLVAGVSGNLVAGGAAGYGFLGIAVALVARLSPGFILPSALLFAALQVGSNALQVQAGLSSAMGSVLSGIVVVALLAFGAIRPRPGEVAR